MRPRKNPSALSGETATKLASRQVGTVSRVSKPAGCAGLHSLPIYPATREATQQVRHGGFVWWRILKPVLQRPGPLASPHSSALPRSTSRRARDLDYRQRKAKA